MTAVAPSSTALETAMVMPRSLKLPVGFMPSSLAKISRSRRADRRGSGTSGVPPSPSDTIGVLGPTGRNSR